jgi:hypothetical protein
MLHLEVQPIPEREEPPEVLPEMKPAREWKRDLADQVRRRPLDRRPSQLWTLVQP